MFSLIIIYTLFEVIAGINFLFFQLSNNISWVIANVAVFFFVQIAVLTVSAGAIYLLNLKQDVSVTELAQVVVLSFGLSLWFDSL